MQADQHANQVVPQVKRSKGQAPGEGGEVGGLCSLQHLAHTHNVGAAQLRMDAVQALGPLLPGVDLCKRPCVLPGLLCTHTKVKALPCGARSDSCAGCRRWEAMSRTQCGGCFRTR